MSTSTIRPSAQFDAPVAGREASRAFLAVPPAVRDAVLLLARVLLGSIMIAHGIQKLVLDGVAKTGAQFAASGVPFPELSAAVAGICEIVAGSALVLGLLTPLAAAVLFAVLAGAFLFVHATKGIFAQQGGWELVAALGLGAAVFGVVGPGRFSLDAWLAARRRG